MKQGDLRMVVGLGNPGREYEGTRHNIGFDVLDALVRAEKGTWEEDRKWKALRCRVEGVLYLKPLTYMNLSGESVRKAADFFKFDSSQMLVVYDEMSLPLGRMRLRQDGSHAGHNGIRSVIEHLSTDAVARLKVGIGSPVPGGAVSHVLGRFAPAERALVERVVTVAADAVSAVQRRGMQSAMNEFNAMHLEG